MNKQERKLKGQAKFKKRLDQIGFTPKVLQQHDRDGIPYNLNCYRTTGKPCSCAMCSPNKRKEPKEKYKIKHKNRFDE